MRLTEAQRRDLDKWLSGSASPWTKRVGLQRAQMFVRLGLLSVVSTLPLTKSSMTCEITPAGRLALSTGEEGP